MPTCVSTETTADHQWELISRAQAGDHDAFAELYWLYMPVVRSNIAAMFRIAAQQHVLEELVQETFLSAWRAIGSVSRPAAEDATPAGWFVVIARNRARDFAKKASTRNEFPALSATGIADPTEGWDRVDTGDTADPETRRYMISEHVTDTLVTRTELARLLALLPAREREAVVRRHLEGQPYKQIQAEMGVVTDAATKQLIRRGMVRLRDAISPTFRDLMLTA